MGNWTYSTGIYDVAKNDGTYMGSINITVDGNGNLNTNATWYDNSGHNNQSSVTLTWVPLSQALVFTAGNTQYDLTYDSSTTPSTFKSNQYEMRFNQNQAWFGASPAVFSVQVNNHSTHNGSITLNADGAGNMSCLGAWSPSGNPNANTQRVRITWQNNTLGWKVEWGSGPGATKDDFSNGQYNSPTNNFTNGVWEGASAADIPGTWQATQTNPLPKPVEGKPYEAHAHKKAV